MEFHFNLSTFKELGSRIVKSDQIISAFKSATDIPKFISPAAPLIDAIFRAIDALVLPGRIEDVISRDLLTQVQLCTY